MSREKEREGVRVEKERVEKVCEERRNASRDGVRLEKERVERMSASREGVRVGKDCV